MAGTMMKRPTGVSLWEWLDLPVPMGAGWPLISPRLAVRLEEAVTDGHYKIRAELPGIDPEKDIDIKVADGVLTIHGERREASEEPMRSEFRYGEFSRSVTLPRGTDAEAVHASYKDGVLEVSFEVPEEQHEARAIPIEHA